MTREFGYAGKMLRVDLSSASLSQVPTAVYADRFLGGRGIAARIYWDEVSPQVKAFDPDNRLIFVTGPLAGFTGLSASRWQVCGKSPATIPEHFCYSNLGGSWGAQLKFSGYDGIVIQGKVPGPVYLLIEDGRAEIRDAARLWGRGAVEVREALKQELGSTVRVVATGPAGDNRVRMASLLADNDASGSSGFGAVMGSKNLKAIAVRGRGEVRAANPERLRELAKYIRQLKEGTIRAMPTLEAGPRMKRQACYGCIRGCMRSVYTAADGKKGKFMCQSAVFYQVRAQRYYGEWNEVPFYANRLCDEYGLDANAIETMIMWLSRCNKADIFTDENTGIPLSQLGSLEFIETLIRKTSLREGIGDVLAEGTVRAADLVGSGAKELITDYIFKAGQNVAYGPRMYIATGLIYAVEPRQPIQQLHEISTLVTKWVEWVNKLPGAYVSSDVIRAIAKRFWGSEVAADFSTYEGKALAAKMVQDRQYAKESSILCDFSWPITDVECSPDHVGDPTIESKVLSAVTGREMDEAGFYRLGERVFNLQRAILVREGHRGRESDILPQFYYTTPLKTAFFNPECLAPGKDGEVMNKRGTVVDREAFERMKDEYYQLRGWDVATGLQTRAKLDELGLGDIARELQRERLVI